MKRSKGIALAIVLSLIMTMLVKTPVMADNTTVTGTVGKETKGDLLYLTTSGGTMQIKIDSNTDLGSCKVILPGAALTAEVYYGSDAYMHAAKLTGGGVGPNISVDRSNTSTVQGTVKEGTTSEIIYLDTGNGTMQIKLDRDTDMSGCRVIMLDKKLQITCARGSDAYMHALSVTDIATVTTTSSSGSSSSNSYAGYPQASGDLDEDSDIDNVIIIGSNKYLIRPDTDFSGCKAYFPGRSVTVYYFKGLDGRNRALAIKDTCGSSGSASSDVIATVKGTISSQSHDDTIYLKTTDGTMKIRLDSSTDTSKCGVLYDDKTVKISVAHGSDEYLHAVTIVDR